MKQFFISKFISLLVLFGFSLGASAILNVPQNQLFTKQEAEILTNWDSSNDVLLAKLLAKAKKKKRLKKAGKEVKKEIKKVKKAVADIPQKAVKSGARHTEEALKDLGKKLRGSKKQNVLAPEAVEAPPFVINLQNASIYQTDAQAGTLEATLKVDFTTPREATSKLWLWSSTQQLGTSEAPNAVNDSPSTSHALEYGNLEVNNVYYYAIQAADSAEGLTAQVSGGPVTAPAVLAILNQSGAMSGFVTADLSWKTTLDAECLVWYASGPGIIPTDLNANAAGPTSGTDHFITISGIVDTDTGKKWYWVPECIDFQTGESVVFGEEMILP